MKFTVLALVVLCIGFVAGEENYHGVAVPPGGMDAWVVTIETTNVYHTPDFGANWQHQEVLTIRDFFDVFFLNETHGWICARLGAIYATTDGGTTWGQQSLGGPKFATRIRFLDENHGWAAGGEAIQLRTTNGGQEWAIQFFPEPPFRPDTVDFYGLWYVHPDTGWLVAGRFPSGDTFAGGQGYIARTMDGGDSWALLRKDYTYDFFDVYFADSREGWVVGGDDSDMSAVVMHSTDGGESWSEQAVPSGATLLRGLAFVGDRHGWACGRNGTIIHTSDGGQTWVEQYTPVDTTLFDIEFADTLRGMVAGNSVVYATTDGGAHWRRVYGGIEEAPAPRQQPAGMIRLLENPSGRRVAFQLSGFAGRYGISLHDATGRVVRELRGAAGSGTGTAAWDGLDGSGVPATPGIYLAQLTARDRTETVRFVYLPAH